MLKILIASKYKNKIQKIIDENYTNIEIKNLLDDNAYVDYGILIIDSEFIHKYKYIFTGKVFTINIVITEKGENLEQYINKIYNFVVESNDIDNRMNELLSIITDKLNQNREQIKEMLSDLKFKNVGHALYIQSVFGIQTVIDEMAESVINSNWITNTAIKFYTLSSNNEKYFDLDNKMIISIDAEYFLISLIVRAEYLKDKFPNLLGIQVILFIPVKYYNNFRVINHKKFFEELNDEISAAFEIPENVAMKIVNSVLGIIKTHMITQLVLYQ